MFLNDPSKTLAAAREDFMKLLKNPENHDKDWPSLSVFKTLKAQTKKKPPKGGLFKEPELDRSWSAISLSRPGFAISPEALPFVLQIWAKSQTEKRMIFNIELENERASLGITDPDYSWEVSDESQDALTIREALWVNRLYALFKDEGIYLLWSYAQSFAINERLLEFETYPDNEESITEFWLDDANLYSLVNKTNPSEVELRINIHQKFDIFYAKREEESKRRYLMGCEKRDGDVTCSHCHKKMATYIHKVDDEIANVCEHCGYWVRIRPPFVDINKLRVASKKSKETQNER
jgi:DNA-directed RNA polymerase subunit M/transcription elongation factor TFIIS